MDHITFFIPVRFPGLNEYISEMNNNRYAGNQMKDEYTTIAEIYSRKQKVIVKEPVHIAFVFIEPNRRRDPDNILSAKKFILDGMTRGHNPMLPNDGQKYIKSIDDDWRVAEENENVGVLVGVFTDDYINRMGYRRVNLDLVEYDIPPGLYRDVPKPNNDNNNDT